MKKTLLLSIIALALIISCKKSKYNSEYFKLNFGGEKRQYLVHKPDNFDTQTNKSLVIALHGGVGSPKNIEDQSQLSVLSDKEGFLVCYPKGYKRTWNAGGCCGKAVEKNMDDVGFISALIDQLIADYNIDPKRVYITGMSNGGFMSYRLACELSGKIAAIAPVAASMNVNSCNPTNPVAIIHFHSEVDSNVPYLGGIGDGISDHYNPPVDSVLNVWSSKNGCPNPFFTTFGNKFETRTWNSCLDSTEIQVYLTKDGGHSWPMGIKPRKKADNVSTVVNASEVMWAFFKAHPKL